MKLTKEQKEIIAPAWAEMQECFVCKHCGKDVDLMVAFTQFQVCGECSRKAHKGLTKP